MIEYEARLWHDSFTTKKHQNREPNVFILHDILEKLKNEFPQSRNGQERATRFWTSASAQQINPDPYGEYSCSIPMNEAYLACTAVMRD